jgi:hypothetical protein
MLKPLSFFLTLFLLLSLLIILVTQKPITITSPNQLENLTENQKVQTKGIVTEERIQGNNKILTLDNNLEIIAPKSIPFLINQSIAVLGVYDNFLKPRIKSQKLRY